MSHAFVDGLKEKFGRAKLEIRVEAPPDAAEELSETEFWRLIALLDWTEAEYNDRVLEPLVNALSQGPVARIYLFLDRLSEKLYQLDTADHAKPLRDSDEGGFLSADEFLYARCCVVANGRAFFEKVLKNPGEFPTEVTFESLLYVASSAFLRKTGKAMVALPAFNFETGSNQAGWQ